MKIRTGIYNWQKIDPRREFTAEDFLYFTEASNTIYFNPYDEWAMEAKRAMDMDIYLNDGEGYVLYELANTSPLRPFTSTILYNKKDTGFKMLLGKNKPIYDLNAEIDPFKNISLKIANEGVDDVISEHKLNQVRKYIRFFFDHVRGRHGFFYICESFEEIKEAIDFFYSKEENKEKKQKHKKDLDDMRKENKLPQLRLAVERHLKMPSKQNKFKMRYAGDFDREKDFCVIRTFMVFRNSLYESHVHISKDKDRIPSLSNEQVGIRDTDVFGKGAREAFKDLGYDEELPPFDLF